jgi:hypothetical protein
MRAQLNRRVPEKAEGEKGSSLIEVLVALLIMLFLMIGILQMFALSYLVNLGSAARTELTYKCEQVMENVRYFSYLSHEGIALPANTGITFAAGTYDLPYSGSAVASSYWGPTQADVVEGEDMPYRLSVEVQDGDTHGVAGQWIVTVSAVPSEVQGARKYIGVGIEHKRVDYVAQLPK